MPVRLVRRDDGDVHWMFSRATVERIEGWQCAARRFAGSPPTCTVAPAGPRQLLIGQWLALPFVLLCAWLLGILSVGSRSDCWGEWPRARPTRWDDELLSRIGSRWRLPGPWLSFTSSYLGWGCTSPPRTFSIASYARLLPDLLLDPGRSVDVARNVSSRPLDQGSSCARHCFHLEPASEKSWSSFFGVVALLLRAGISGDQFGCRLGHWRLAIALAAQKKTVENLFGAFSIGADQPFREGDFVRIEDFVGTVETIGLRSTRVRTLDRTLISIPNGKLAEMRVESFAVRDRHSTRLHRRTGLPNQRGADATGDR